MYACIRRYEVDAGSAEDLVEAGHRLGTGLSQAPGFVAAVAVDEAGGTLITVGLFDDVDGLQIGAGYTEQWTAENRGRLGLVSLTVAIGEVVAQRGL
jgi:hypothetical protein